MTDFTAQHMSHCDQGENVGSCKYGDSDCPALAHPAADVCASCGFPWGTDPVRHAEFCDNRTLAHPAAPQGEGDAWRFLCQRLQRNPDQSEESDTCSLRSAVKAMVAFAALAPAAIASGREGA